MPKLKGVIITCNYPDDTADAAIPSEMEASDLYRYLRALFETEPDMTSFVLVASLHKE